jgi:hypothetical protein
MSVQPTQASSHRREKKATRESGSTASRANRAKIEISANDYPIVKSPLRFTISNKSDAAFWFDTILASSIFRPARGPAG